MKNYISTLQHSFLLCVCLIFASLARAQSNNFFAIDNLDRWTTTYLTQNGMIGQTVAIRTSYKNDFNGKTYTKFDVTKLMPSREKYEFYYCQEANRVYLWSSEKSTEDLVMDFGLNVGDNFTMLDGTVMQVEDVGDTCVFSDPYSYYKTKNKMLKFKNIKNPEKKDVWIEGIGSLYTGFLNMNSIDSIAESSVCYLVVGADGYYLPIHNKEYMKTLWFGTDKTFPFEKGNSLSYEFIDDTLHITGCLNMRGYYHYLFCFTENNRIRLTWHDLPDMFDSYSSYPDIINVKVPGFKPGIYTIVGTDILLECKNPPSPSPSPYDLDGDGVLTLNDITTLINVYLEMSR